MQTLQFMPGRILQSRLPLAQPHLAMNPKLTERSATGKRRIMPLELTRRLWAKQATPAALSRVWLLA